MKDDDDDRLTPDDEESGEDGEEDEDSGGADEITCPYCGEPGDVAADFDPSEPGEQVFVQDCGVCCRPWTVTVHVGHDGNVRFDVGRS